MCADRATVEELPMRLPHAVGVTSDPMSPLRCCGARRGGFVSKSINSPNFYTLSELLTLVRAGQIAMPEFQRDFVWTPPEVSELLVSIARRWPCGTFLLLEGGEGDAREFDLRPVKNAPEIVEDDVEIV